VGRAGGPVTTLYKRDIHGGSYGGTIQAFNMNASLAFSPTPKGPVNGASYSTAQMIQGFTGSTGGFTAGSATVPPFVAAAVNANTYCATSFQLADLDQVVSFTGLFDQYRIDKVELKFTPKDNAVNTLNTASPNDEIPVLALAMDFDDNNLPTSWAYIRQYDNAQSVAYGSGGLFVTIHPSYTPAVFAGAAFSGYAVERANWTDCSNTGVQHYGLKGFVSALTAGSTSNAWWIIQAKYFVSFRNTR
jgi:hypothetical protein